LIYEECYAAIFAIYADFAGLLMLYAPFDYAPLSIRAMMRHLPTPF